MDNIETQSIVVIEAGTRGITLAKMFANTNKDVMVWSAIPEEVRVLEETRRHKNLEGVIILRTICFITNIQKACENKDIILFVVLSPFVWETALKTEPFICDNQIIVDVARGVESSTLMTLTEVIRDVIDNDMVHYVALFWPTHAEEVAVEIPTTIVLVCEDLAVAQYVQKFFLRRSWGYIQMLIFTELKFVEL